MSAKRREARAARRKAEPWTPPKLAPGDHWTYTCGECGMWIQGGQGALDEHRKVVHQ